MFALNEDLPKRNGLPREAYEMVRNEVIDELLKHVQMPGFDDRAQTRGHLLEIIKGKRLTPLFQPIVSMAGGGIVGYEGLIRGPSDSSLHSPVNLFRAAAECGLTV